MKKSSFFSAYVLVHGLILALVVGMAAAAFSMQNGLIILDTPTDAVTSANTRGSMVGKFEAGKQRVKRSLKPIAGGCEMWESNDFFRIKRWGTATSSPHPKYSMTCNCPNGFTKIQIRQRQESIQDFSGINNEWLHKNNNFGINTNQPTVCGTVPATSDHINVSHNELPYIYFCVHRLCGQGSCDCIMSGNECNTIPELTRGNWFDFMFRNQAKAATDDCYHTMGKHKVGCGLVLKYQSGPLTQAQSATVTTWVCVNTSTTSTVTGWDN